MSGHETILLVIDAQESFRQRDYWDEDLASAYIERQQALIDGAEARGIPVVQIFHVDESGPFSESSGFVKTLAPLRIAPGATFRKGRHSALVGSGLDVWLTENGVRHIIVSGIRTEQCCETTTRHASDMGYKVSYVMDATLTFKMVAESGRVYTPQDIMDRTELVLAGRFAEVKRVETLQL